MGPKTSKALNTGVGDFLGVGKEMNSTEVPTLRDTLREAQLIKEQTIITTGKDARNIDMGKIINIINKKNSVNNVRVQLLLKYFNVNMFEFRVI